ncbi:hypothetical protein DM02DRAFT_353948 [Periconia macrospinosa]|uniref:Uncharacterized protein n=1 Tax=Periconia macrospinosa TaxID=97972 RepID=A0A2V1E9C2_9PLEO|nr:hypothetical protein DM02DRAFT_353948 [Periconia macrospinosa]
MPQNMYIKTHLSLATTALHSPTSIFSYSSPLFVALCGALGIFLVFPVLLFSIVLSPHDLILLATTTLLALLLLPLPPPTTLLPSIKYLRQIYTSLLLLLLLLHTCPFCSPSISTTHPTWTYQRKEPS